MPKQRYSGSSTIDKYNLIADFSKGKIPHNKLGERILEIDEHYRPRGEKIFLKIIEYARLFLSPLIPLGSRREISHLLDY